MTKLALVHCIGMTENGMNLPLLNTLSVSDSLSAGVIHSRLFVYFFRIRGEIFVRSSSKSCLSIVMNFLNPCGSSDASSFIKAW